MLGCRNKRWKMEDGRWKMEDGRWKMEDGDGDVGCLTGRKEKVFLFLFFTFLFFFTYSVLVCGPNRRAMTEPPRNLVWIHPRPFGAKSQDT